MTPRLLLPDAPVEFCVERLGGLGDGIGQWQGKPVFVPKALPGERVRAKIISGTAKEYRARLVEVLTPSGERQTAPCSHFSQCGGCSLQQMSQESYRKFKRGLALGVLKRLALDEALLRPLIETGPGSRRRVEFKVAVEKGQVRLGYLQARSHQLVDIAACPLLEPALERLILPLKACLSTFSKPGCIQGVRLVSLHAGSDMLLILRHPLKPQDSERLKEFAGAHGLLRVCVQQEGEPQKRLWGQEPQETIAGIGVALPPGAFQQASVQAQERMCELVVAGLQGCRFVADIFAGCGTYSFPLLKNGARVHAYEGEEAMVTAMENARRQHGLESTFEAFRRDLFTHPLNKDQLNRFDGCVINPPRAGAQAQVTCIAQSSLARVVMVSCNPATFERDARRLLEQGFRMVSLTPVDQFYWSSHLELVASFTRSQGMS